MSFHSESAARSQDEGEVDDAGHGGLLPAGAGHDLLLYLAVPDAQAEDG